MGTEFLSGRHPNTTEHPETNKKAGVFTSHPRIKKTRSAECIFHGPANFVSSCANRAPITIPTHLQIGFVVRLDGHGGAASVLKDDMLQTQ
jgi:hypothetical protein